MIESALNFDDSRLTPDVSKNEPFSGGSGFPDAENPFNNTSQPVQTNIGIGIDTYDLNKAFDQAQVNLSRDPFVGAKRFETPSIPGYEAALESNYFDKIGVTPGMDVEEIYGKAQTNWDTLVNKGLFASFALAGNQAVEQFLSLSDTFGLFKGDSPFKQDELDAIDEWQKKFNNKYHIFQTQEDRNTFWNVANFGTMIQQSGYAIGAFLEIAAEEMAMSALTAATFGATSELQAARTIQLGTRISKVLNRTRELERNLQSADTLRKIFNNSLVKFVNPLSNVTDFAMDLKMLRRADQFAFGSKATARTVARGFGAFYRDLRIANMAITEAKATIAPVMTEMYEASVQRYKDANGGVEPSEEQKKQFKEQSFKTVNTEGAVQAAWIAYSDKVIFDGIFKTFKGLRFLDDGLVAKGIFQNTKKAIKEGGDMFVAKTGTKAFIHQLKTSPFKTLLKAPTGYLKANFMEGLQESGQNVIDEATKEWYLHKYGTKEEKEGIKTISDFLYDGAKSQLTMDGLKTFMSGFLTGGIMNVLGGVTNVGVGGIDRLRNFEGYQQKVKRADEERNKLVTSLNAAYKDKGNFYRSLVNMNAAMTESAKNGNKKEYWDYRDNFVNKFVLEAIRSGTDEVLLDRFKESVDELSTEEFKEAFKGTMFEAMPEEQAKTKLKSFMSEFELKVNETKELYTNIKNIYGNPYNPSLYKVGSPEYNAEVANYMAAEQAFEQIAFSKSTYLDIAKRQAGILDSLKNTFSNMSFNTLYSMTSPTITLENELKTLQKEYDALADSTLKEEKKKKIDALKSYKTRIEKALEELDGASNLVTAAEVSKRIEEIKQEFIKENSGILIDILKIDNPKAAQLNTEDVTKILNDVFDYLHLQSDYESALSYFNLISNPYEFKGLHQAHLNELFDLMGDQKAFEEAGKEYVAKNPKNNKSFVLKVKNYWAVYQPNGEFVDKFEDKELADRFAEELDEINDKNANRVKIEVKDKNGDSHTVEIVENNFYVTEDIGSAENAKKLELTKIEKNKLDQLQAKLDAKVEELVKTGLAKEEAEKKAFDELFVDDEDELNSEGEEYETLKEKSDKAEARKKRKSKYTSDVIKIVSIEGDEISYQLNYDGEIYKSSVEEFGKTFGYVSNFKDIDLYHRLFLLNRDKEFEIYVNRKYGRIHTLDENDYRTSSISVQAKLVGEFSKEGDFVLYMEYKNPNPKAKNKKIKVLFNIDYYKKYGLKPRRGFGLYTEGIFLSKITELQKQAQEQQLEDQQEALQNLIKRVENNLAEAEARRKANRKRLDDSKTELENMLLDLEIATEELAKMPVKKVGRKSEAYKKLVMLTEKLPNLIASMEATVKDLEDEAANLNDLVDALTMSRDSYYYALDYVQTTKKPLRTDEEGKLVIEGEEQIPEMENELITKRYSKNEIDELIYNTEFEIEQIKEVLEDFRNFTDGLKDIWNKLRKYKDVLDALATIVNRQDLRNKLEEQEKLAVDDPDKQNLLKELRKSLVADDLDARFAIELAKRYKQAEAQFRKIEEVLFPKLERLKKAAEQLGELEPLRERVKMLTAVRDELFTEVYYIEERRRIELESTSEKEKKAKDKKANVVESTNDEGFHKRKDGTKRPYLRLTSLYVTTGLHFEDLEDTIINNKNGNARFFKFTENINFGEGEFFLIPLIKGENDDFGITYDDNDIKLIVVKLDGGVYKPVGMTGEVLETPTKENLIYTSLRMNNDALFDSDISKAREWIENTFVTDGLKETEIINMINKYRAFVKKIRKSVKEKKETILPIVGKTKGSQVYLPKDITTGLPKQLSLRDRLIDMSAEDYVNLVHPNGQAMKLLVSTDNKDDLLPGRVYFKRDDGQLFRVFSRQISQLEKNNFISLLKYLANLTAKEKIDPESLTTIEKANRTTITNYLKGLVFWTTATNTIESPNKFYITSKGFLYRGDNVIPFTEKDIEENATMLTDGLYHQVNNSMISKVNEAFYQTVVTPTGEIKLNKYDNYQHYLITDENNDLADESVLYTNIPMYDAEDENVPQVKSSNIIYLNEDDEFKPIIKEKEEKEIDDDEKGEQVILEGGKKGFSFGNNKNKENKKTKSPDEEKEEKEEEEKPSGKKKWNRGTTTTDEEDDKTKEATSLFQRNASMNIEDLEEDESDEETGADNKDAFNKTDDTTPFGSSPFDLSDPDDDEVDFRLQLAEEVTEIENFEEIKNWFAKNLPSIPLYKVMELIEGKAWGAFKKGSVYLYEGAEIGTGYHEAFEAVWHSYLDHQEQMKLVQEFRSREGEFTNPFTNETKKYSEASLYDVREMLAEEFRTFVLNDINDIKNEKSKTLFGKILDFFKNLLSTIKKMAGFSNKENTELNSHINSLFKKINKGGFAKAQFVRNVSDVAVYREVIPNTSQEFTMNVLEGITSFFFHRLNNPNMKKEGMSQEEINFRNIESLLSENAENSKLFKELFDKSYKDIYTYMLGDKSEFFEEFSRIYEHNKKRLNRDKTSFSNEEIAYMKNDLAKNKFIKKNRFASMSFELFEKPENKDILYRLFKGSLEKYGFKFSSVEDKAETSVSDNLGIIDVMSIDPKRMTAASFKILLATLTDDQYVIDSKTKVVSIKAKRNKLQLPKLVVFEDIVNLLLNELNSTYSFTKLDSLGNEVTIDALTSMFNKLDLKYFNPSTNRYREGYVWIQKLKDRLKYKGDKNSYFTKDENQITIDDLKLMVGFEKSLMNKQNNPLRLILGDNGTVYSMNALEESNQKEVRNEWENNIPRNIKRRSKKSELDKSIFVIDDKTGEIVFDEKSQIFKDLKNLDNKTIDINFSVTLSYLKELGITFQSVDYSGTVPIAPVTFLKYKKAIESSFKSIKEAIASTNPDKRTIRNINDLYSSIGPEYSNVNVLINAEASMRNQDNVLTHRTASGETQYSITLPSSLNYVITAFNRAETLEDFIASCPQFGYVTKDAKGKTVINVHPYQRNSQLLKPGGLFFNESGIKRKNATGIDYYLISGVSSFDTNGVDTAKLTYPDRVMQEMNYILNVEKNQFKPIYYTIINSDKSTEFGLSFKKPFIDSDKALYGVEGINFKETLDIYLDHLSDEIDAAIEEKKNNSLIQYYSEDVIYLGHFKDVLGIKTDAELAKSNKRKSAVQLKYESVLNGKMTKDEFLSLPEVADLIKADIEKTVDYTLDSLVDLGIFKRYVSSEEGSYMYSTNAINSEALKKFNIEDRNAIDEDTAKAIVLFITVNKELAVTEQHKMFYGHPSLYKELAKRSNGINSSKDGIVDNPEIIRMMDKLIPRLDGRIRSDDKIQTFNNISFKDVEVVSRYFKEYAETMYASMIEDEISKQDIEKRIGVKFTNDGKFESFILDGKGKHTGEIKAYINMVEADGMAYMMPDMYRDMLFLSSKLSEKQQKQIDYEIAFEIIDRTDNVLKTHMAYRNYKKENPTLYKWAKKIYEKGNPGNPLPVLKPQYFGYAANSSLMHTVFLKHSTQPKFYRSVKGTEFEKLYLAAQKNQIDIIGFESGQKVGNVYSDKKGNFTSITKLNGAINVDKLNLPSNLPVQELYMKYYGIQTEQPAKYKNAVVRGTQVTKLIMANFKSDGKFINKEAERLVDEYNDTLVEIIKLGKEELLNELGIEFKDGEYFVNDYTKMITILKSELDKRDLPINLIDALAVDPETKMLLYKLDTLNNRDKIDNILNSIVDSRVISAKMYGKSSVQVAYTGYNTKNRDLMYLDKNGIYQLVDDIDSLSEEEKKTVRVTSSDLKFYRLEDGKIQKMEVYIPWLFEGVNPEDLGFKLKNGVYTIPENFDSKLLEMIGFRIPTQGMNSIESIVIKGFLPRENGDMIVVPSEIVGKSGSDFDIDKINLYIPNYKFKYSKFNPQEISEFKESIHFKSIPKSIRNRINALDNFNTVVEELNMFSVSSGLGAYGNLKDYLDTMPDMSQADRDFYTEFKNALVQYNIEKRNLLDANKIQRKNFKPLVESIEYIDSSLNSKAGLQNRLREIMERLYEMPENYRQIVIPNGAQTLKNLAEEVKKLKNIESAENSKLALRKFIQSAEVRERYLSGKRLVGIAALQTTSHVMAQIADIVLEGSYDISRMKFIVKHNPKDRKEIIIKLNFNENKEYELKLNAKTDAEGRWISENISEALTGFVDAAKDPFVFDLNINNNTAGTWFYLQRLGVPLRDLAYFFNQPSVEKFMKAESVNNSLFKSINSDKAFKEVLYIQSLSEYFSAVSPENATLMSNLLKYIEQEKQLRKENDYKKIKDHNKRLKDLKVKFHLAVDKIRTDIPKVDTKELRDAIENLNKPKHVMTTREAMVQVSLLADFLEYTEQASYLTEFINSIGYDNQKPKTIIENRLQSITWNRMITSNFIKNPERILSTTFIGEMKEQREDLENVFASSFVSLNPRAEAVFNKMFDYLSLKDLFMTDDDKQDVVKKYQNFFITYIIQNMPFKHEGFDITISNMYDVLMKGNDSIPNILRKLKENNDFEISQNPVIKELLPIFGMVDDTHANIKLIKNKMDTFKNDVLIESINNLIEYADTKGDLMLQHFVKNLAIFSVLQSGLQSSTINFTKILPAQLYSKMVNDILNVYEKNSVEIDANLVWKQFHQNNKSDRRLIRKPFFKPNFDKYTNIITMDSDNTDIIHEFISVTRPKNGLTNEKIEELKKRGKSYLAWDVYIYQREMSLDDIYEQKPEQVKYVPIIPLGDGRNYTETSLEDIQVSNVTNNNIVDENGNRVGSLFSDAIIPSYDELDEETGNITPGEGKKKLTFSLNPDTDSNEILEPSKAAVIKPARPASLKATDEIRKSIIQGLNKVVKESARKYVGKEINKIKVATQFIGDGGKTNSTTTRMKNLYEAFGLANTRNYDADDLIYVSSNGARENAVPPVKDGKLNGYYKAIDIAIEAGARFIMDTKEHLAKTAGYNVGELALANYLLNKGYEREDKTGIWTKKSDGVIESEKEVKPITVATSSYSEKMARQNKDTGFIYNENIYSLQNTPDVVGANTSVIRKEPNAFAIVTKKIYNYDTKENVEFEDTEKDFEEFKQVNTELMNKIMLSDLTKFVFPKTFATQLEALPKRFAEWLQQELYDKFGVITELNDKETGLITTGVNQEIASKFAQKRRKLKDGNIYFASEINSKLLESLGYTRVQIINIIKQIC